MVALYCPYIHSPAHAHAQTQGDLGGPHTTTTTTTTTNNNNTTTNNGHHSTSKGRLYVANAGDSRAVLCRAGGIAFALSEDHKPAQDRETHRIYAAGGFVNEVGESDLMSVLLWISSVSR